MKGHAEGMHRFFKMKNILCMGGVMGGGEVVGDVAVCCLSVLYNNIP